MKRPILALALLAAIAGPASAGGAFDAAGAWTDKPDLGTTTGQVPTAAEPLDYNRVCEALGPGFVNLAGTTTCVKIGGFVKVGTSFGSSHGGGWGKPFPR